MPEIGQPIKRETDNDHTTSDMDVSYDCKGVSDELRVYKFHGLEYSLKPGSIEAVTDCPFCGRSKLYINSTNSLYHCKTCDVSGNSLEFMRRLHSCSMEELTTDDADELCRHRGFLYVPTINDWQVTKSLITREWLIPSFNQSGSLIQLHRYVRQHDTKMGVYASPNTQRQPLGQHLWGLNLWDNRKSTAVLCEGIWDAMALYEVLGRCKWEDGEGSDLTLTSNLTASLLGDINVIAVPGCNVWSDSWIPLLSGKRVILAYDSDHPRPIKTRVKKDETVKYAEPVGASGMKRVAQSLATATEPPSSINWIEWGSKGYDPELPDGTDLRDILTESNELRSRIFALQGLLSRIKPIPPEWIEGRTAEAVKKGTVEINPIPCQKWSILLNSLRKAYKWFPEMEHAILCMLATVASTESVGDQLWIRVIGVPGSGKTSLAEALCANRKYVRGVSTMKGFFSGYQTDREGEEDNSLLAKVNGKTVILKDADTLLKSQDRERILSEARDVYDRVARPDYRNKTSREYSYLSVTWILCGTPSIRELDSSDLGARFLDVIIMETIDRETEDDILMRVARKAFMSTSIRCNGTPESQTLPTELEVKGLASGYVNFLRENAQRLAEPIQNSVTDNVLLRILNLSRFVSYMRARPSDKVETVERELSSRLMSQLSRMAVFMAVVMNKKSIDEEVMKRVTQVAIDTGKGRTLDIATHLYEASLKTETLQGLDYRSVGSLIGRDNEQTHQYLRFLYRIKAVDKELITGRGYRSMVYRLSDDLRSLYEKVILHKSSVQ